jgi:hypothetical protein
VAYLAVLVTALACGLWPGSIHPGRRAPDAARLPVFSTVTAGQVIYFLLIWPVVAAFRIRLKRWEYWRDSLLEMAILLVLSVPWWVCGAWIASVGPQTAVWGAAHVTAAGLVGLALGAWAKRGKAGGLAVLAGALLSIGWVCFWYIAADLLLMESRDTIWSLSPVLRTYSLSRPQLASTGPGAFWPISIWLGAAGILALSEWAVPEATPRGPQPPQPAQNQAW